MKTRTYYFISFLVISLLVISVLIPATPAIGQTNGPTIGMAHVKVAHFAPFATSLDGTSVAVTVDALPAGVFKFGEISPTFNDIPAGIHHIEVTPIGGVFLPISADIDLVADTYYTISLIGNGTLQPLEIFKQADDTVAPVIGAKVRFTHLAPINAIINNTKVDICTSTNVPLLTGLAYKDFNDPYLTLPPGDYKLKITQPGSSCAVIYLDVPSIRLSNGQILDVFAIGDVIHQPLALVSTTGITFTPFAHVKLGHFAPFAATVDDTSVTVEISGVPVLANFKFGDMTPGYIDFPAEVDLLVKVIRTGESLPLITQNINLETGADYTISAIGDVTNQPLELFTLVDDNTRPSSGARVRIAHFAPISGDIEQTRFNICTVDNVLLKSGFGYKDFTNPYLDLAAGIYNLKITAPGFGCLIKLYDIPQFTLIDFTVISAFAIGDITHLPVGVTLRWDQPPPIFIPVIWK